MSFYYDIRARRRIDDCNQVAMFIVIELVIFPLGCGVMLDGCTIWVFPEASFQSRMAFFTQAPLTAMFYHWVAGTMFM